MCVRNDPRARPYGFIGCGAIDVTKPSRLILFSDIHGPEPYAYIGSHATIISHTPIWPTGWFPTLPADCRGSRPKAGRQHLEVEVAYGPLRQEEIECPVRAFYQKHQQTNMDFEDPSRPGRLRGPACETLAETQRAQPSKLTPAEPTNNQFVRQRCEATRDSESSVGSLRAGACLTAGGYFAPPVPADTKTRKGLAVHWRG